MTRALTMATLGQLHRPPGWVWVYCARCVPMCQHRAGFLRTGAARRRASSSRLMPKARGTKMAI